MAIAIDTDKAVEALRDVWFKKEQARVLIDQLVPGNDQIVTKDLLQAEIQKLKSELIIWMVGLHIASMSLMVALITNL